MVSGDSGYPMQDENRIIVRTERGLVFTDRPRVARVVALKARLAHDRRLHA